MEQAQRPNRSTRLTESMFRSRRDMNNGFGDALAKAFELAVTPAIFGFFGYLIDRALGTSPLFALFLFVFTFCYVSWRLFSTYDARMKVEQERLTTSGGEASE